MPDDERDPTPTLPDPDPMPVQLEVPDFQRLIREAVAAATAEILAAQPAAQIPAGGNTPYLLDADALPTAEKIRRGLTMRPSQ